MFIEFFNQFVEIVQNYWVAFAALGGIALFEPAIINVLKWLKVVGEDSADEVQAVINAVLFFLFVGVRILFPNFDVGVVDSVLGQVAGVLAMLLSFLGQFGITRVAYKKFWKGRFGALGYYHS